MYANMANESMKKAEIIYPELSYGIIGAAFEVFNEEGYGRREHYYREALYKTLRAAGISSIKERLIQWRHKDGTSGRYFVDLLVEDKIVVEIKVKYRMEYVDIRQVTDYLRAGNYKLAILVYFTKSGVKYRRVLNPFYTE